MEMVLYQEKNLNKLLEGQLYLNMYGDKSLMELMPMETDRQIYK